MTTTPDPAGVDDAVLDNLVWHALAGPQAGLALTSADGAARRYLPAISPFCAVDHLDDAGWDALAALPHVTAPVVLMRREVGAVPPEWVELHRELGTQYVAGDLGGGPSGVVTQPLGVTDAADMTALAAETEPGPYGVDGWRTGGFVGVRRSGRLVAMAGERFRAEGWAEVSAVCVHPSARGRGLGAAVTLAVADGIRARGDRATLHVREHNATARRLYERLGFVERTTVDVVVARPAD